MGKGLIFYQILATDSWFLMYGYYQSGEFVYGYWGLKG